MGSTYTQADLASLNRKLDAFFDTLTPAERVALEHALQAGARWSGQSPDGSEDDVVGYNHFYIFGELYDTVGACDQLELSLGTLKRRGLLSEQAWQDDCRQVVAIRNHLESLLQEPS
jgi:hypothetical protein